MSNGKPATPNDRWSDQGCPADRFARRSFLRGTVAAGLAGAAAVSGLGSDAALAGTASGVGDRTTAMPFNGEYQAGIATPPQPTGTFVSFDVTASDRSQLADLFRTLTSRARFLTSGGKPPKAPRASPQHDNGILGPTIVPDALTVTVGVGATLFDDRFGLAALRPAQLETMKPFRHDDLNPALTQGDLLVQVCANHRDTTVHALVDILAHTNGAMKVRWLVDGQRNPPRPTGTPRDWFGFKDGIANTDTTNTAQMNHQVWVQPGTAEPAWAAGGSYQAIRIVHFDVEKWQGVPVAQQERIFGRRKASGAPMYAVSEHASELLDPVYTNDPQGLITPLNSHIRLANPQTPETAATSAILRRSYDFDRGSDVNGHLDVGHAFVCFQRELNTYVAMQTRLEDEMLVPYISPRGGGYFFALPGVRDNQDYYARGLLS
jgi:deferrochelatase/peroxidase EfeB